MKQQHKSLFFCFVLVEGSPQHEELYSRITALERQRTTAVEGKQHGSEIHIKSKRASGQLKRS